MPVKTELIRNDNGFPEIVKVTEGSQFLDVRFDRDYGSVVEGSKRSLRNENLWKALRLVYPVDNKTVLTVPEPLSVVNVTGGKTILYDPMEDLLKWKDVAGTVVLDNTVAFNGANSLKLTCGAAEDEVKARRYFSMPLSRRIMVEFLFAFEDGAKLADFDVDIGFFTGTRFHEAYVKYDRAAKQWDLNGTVISDTQFFLKEVVDISGPWHFIKYLLDFEANQLRDFQVNHNISKGNLAAIPVAANATYEHSYVTLIGDNKAGNELNIWIDDFRITEIT